MTHIKKLLIAVLIIAGVLAIGATLFLNKLDGMIAEMIQTEGSLALGVPVSVGSVSTDLKQGTASVVGLSIDNVDGYSETTAFEVARIEAVVNYQDQTIKSITIDQPIINAELIGGQNNFQALLDNMPPAAATDASKESDSANELVITIDKLSVARATVKLKITQPELGMRSFIMDDLVMTNLSGNIDQLSDEILVRLAKHISNQISDYAQDQLKSRAKQELKQKLKDKLGDKLKGLGL